MSKAPIFFAALRLCSISALLLLRFTGAASGTEQTPQPVGTTGATSAAPAGPASSADDSTAALNGWKIVSISIPKDGEIKDAYVELKSPSGRMVTLTPGVSSKEGVTLARVDWSGSPVHADVTLRKGKASVELSADASLVSKKNDLRRQPAQIEIESKFIEVTDAVAEHLLLPSHHSVMDELPGAIAPSAPSKALNLAGVLKEKEAEEFLASLMAIKGAAPDGTPNVDVLSAPRVTTRSQQRAVVEIIREFRFPTDFTPPDQANEHWTPKAFVTRNAGITVEVEPVVTEGNTIDLNVAPEVVEFLGFIDFETKAPLFTATRAPGKTIVDRTMDSIPSFESKGRPYIPVFSTRKTQTTVSMFPGNTLIFMGTGETEDTKPFKPLSAGRQLIVLVRASIIDPLAPTAAPQKEPATAPDESPKFELDGPVLPPNAGVRDAKPVEGKPGFVTSPYAPKAGYVDVRGFPSGTEVRDPYTGNYFAFHDPADTTLSHSPLYSIYFVVGWVFGYANPTVLVTSLAAICTQRRRRVLSASISCLSWIVLTTGTICALAYLAEFGFAVCSRNPYERQAFITRAFGSYCLLFWLQIFGSVIAPQLFWFRRSRTNPCISLSIALAIVTLWAFDAGVRYITDNAEFLPQSWKH